MTQRLTLSTNLDCHDQIYEKLIALGDSGGEAGSLRVYARLILLLMNHIGDEAVILEAMALAGRGATPGETRALFTRPRLADVRAADG